MTTKIRLPDDLYSVTGRKGKRARIHPNQAITDANAVNSPLLRLPTEVREMILRMVVGDKLIHVFEVYHVNDHNDIDEEGTLARSLCVAKGASPRLDHVTTPSPSSVKESGAFFQRTHRDCIFVFDPIGGSNYKVSSGIFRTSRDISREALRIFWHTNQFYFECCGALKKFLCALKQVKVENFLKHVTILYCFGTPNNSEWAQINTPSSISALRGLATLELHTELWRRMKAMPSDEDRLSAINQGLEQLKYLRLLNLKKVSVTISYSEKFFSKDLQRGQLEAIANNVRRRLLDPVITPSWFNPEDEEVPEKCGT